MKEIHLLSKNERGLFFKTASDIKKMPLEIIEKDIQSGSRRAVHALAGQY